MPSKRSAPKAQPKRRRSSVPTTRFFHYPQNNSGGSFSYDLHKGITHHVIIEAVNYSAANERAEQIGLYWNGCEAGTDCECCGDRWSPLWKSDKGEETPKVYGQPVAQVKELFAWMKPGREIAVHYLNGKVKWFGVEKSRT